MPDKARITEVSDAVLAFLGGVINATPPDTLTPGYAPTDTLETLDGKRLRVFPVKYGDVERLARRRVQTEYSVAVVCEIPYLAAASPGVEAVPPAWVDDQVAWVEDNVYDPLNRSHVHRADGLLLGTLTCWSCSTTVVYDPVRLAEEKVFVSVVEVAYREGEEG